MNALRMVYELFKTILTVIDISPENCKSKSVWLRKNFFDQNKVERSHSLFIEYFYHEYLCFGLIYQLLSGCKGGPGNKECMLW